MENVMKKENEKSYNIATGIFLAMVFGLYFAYINDKIADELFYMYLMYAKDNEWYSFSLAMEYYNNFYGYSFIFSAILGIAFTHIGYMSKIIGWPIFIIGVLDILCGFYFLGIECIGMFIASFLSVFIVYFIIGFIWAMGDPDL